MCMITRGSCVSELACVCDFEWCGLRVPRREEVKCINRVSVRASELEYHKNRETE